MALKINTLQINSETERKLIVDNSNKKLVNGISVSVSSDLGALNNAYRQLRKEETITEFNSEVTQNEFAMQILSSFNCSISNEPKSYSLLIDQTDTENIDNENIIDEKLFTNLTNEKVSATKNFKSTDTDSFYTLDDAVEKTLSDQAKVSKNIIEVYLQNLTAEVIRENFSSSGTTIKQIKG